MFVAHIVEHHSDGGALSEAEETKGCPAVT
jgi:hypothetical protein